MAIQQNFISFLFTFFCLSCHLLLIACENDHDSKSDESPFTYEEGTEKGPKNWGYLDSHWQTCDKGRLQSPIDLLDQRVQIFPSLGKLERGYKPAPAVVRNRGHDIQVEWKGDAGKIITNGTEYKLLQCHWHSPSEHTANGKRYNMELHIVRKNFRGDNAVVGILYKLGRPDPFLAQLLHHINITEGGGVDLGIVSPGDIKFGSRKYYRYIGSLTVPPCAGGVLWTILTKVRTVSREQIRALRDAVHYSESIRNLRRHTEKSCKCASCKCPSTEMTAGFEANARPIQHQNGRPVYLYRAKA